MLAHLARGRRAALLAAEALTRAADGTTPSTTTAAWRGGGAPALAAAAQQQRRWATNSHDVFNTHQDSPANNKATPFDFSPTNYDRIATILAHYPSNWAASAMIPVLDLAQQQNDGWLSLAAMNKVAAVLGVPPIRVYEVATFYTMFNRSPIGRFHVMVCGTTPCRLAGAERVHEALVKALGVDYGGTTPCGTFTLGEMECMGACANAPMIAVADYSKGVEGFSYLYYEDLTPADAVGIVEDLRSGRTPKAGSQHRSVAEPAGTSSTGTWVPSGSGRTTLNFESSGGKPPGPFCRDLDAPEAQITPPPPPPGPPPPPPPPAAPAK